MLSFLCFLKDTKDTNMGVPRWIASVAEALSAISAVLVLVLGVVLFVVLPSYPVVSCSWEKDAAIRYLLIADPQMEGPRTSTQGTLDNQMNDLYYTFITSVMGFWNGPFDGVVMLGDLMAHPYSLSRYDETLHRFRKSFMPVEENIKANGNLFYLAGNHDLGYGGDDYPNINTRFESDFGPRHWSKEVHGMELIGFDGIDLDGKLATPKSWNFISRFESSASPKILFMHIPLWKPAGSCNGDEPDTVLYRDGSIRTQNTLSEETTSKILRIPNLKAVFTGHDHEGCDYTHPGNIPEYTIRSMLGDYGGNTALLSWDSNDVSVQQCPFLTTKTILVIAITLPVMLLISITCSILVLCSTRTKQKSE